MFGKKVFPYVSSRVVWRWISSMTLKQRVVWLLRKVDSCCVNEIRGTKIKKVKELVLGKLSKLVQAKQNPRQSS